MPLTTATEQTRSCRDIADDLNDALDRCERVAIPLGGFVELPALASKLDRIAASIADIEFTVPDQFCEQLDLDLTQVRSDFRRLASTLMNAANSGTR